VVKRSGQSTAEFVLMLALLTAIGIALMNKLTAAPNGAISKMETNARDAVKSED
jgi:hypothetical protein